MPITTSFGLTVRAAKAGGQAEKWNDRMTVPRSDLSGACLHVEYLMYEQCTCKYCTDMRKYWYRKAGSLGIIGPALPGVWEHFRTRVSLHPVKVLMCGCTKKKWRG